MKAIAVDDEPMALDIVRMHASKVPYLELKATFANAFSALEYLQRENVDLLFLDIKMPDISGIEFFNSLSKKPLLIFTTAYSEHAATSFEMDAIDYLLKPFSLSRFIKACNKAYEIYNFRQNTKEEDYIFVKTGYEQVKLRFDDILYLEASGNYVTFILQDKKVLSRSTFTEIQTVLPENRFTRIHRSFIVALDKIEKVERHQVAIGKFRIPISEGYIENLSLMLKRRS